VLCSGWYNDNIAGLDFLVLSSDGGETAAGCEEEDLVDGVDLGRLTSCVACLQEDYLDFEK